MNSRTRETTLPAAEAQARVRRLTRRGFLVGGVAALAGLGGYEWLTRSGEIGELAWPQRSVLNGNGTLSKDLLLSPSHQARTFRPDQIGKLKANGHLGLDDDDELKDWKLMLDPGAGVAPIALRLSDVQSLPARKMITNFCCIEGWNTVAQWTGAGFSDFLSRFLPKGHRLPNYVYLSTPDEEYYVGLDMKSALHPQTLLAWQLNGEDLTPEHGAPLRLAIPVKYGIKNLKRIGTIRLTDQRPADYWAENGYDWFAGL